MCLKLSNLTTLPFFIPFYQLHHTSFFKIVFARKWALSIRSFISWQKDQKKLFCPLMQHNVSELRKKMLSFLQRVISVSSSSFHTYFCYGDKS